eukprot:47274_1
MAMRSQSIHYNCMAYIYILNKWKLFPAHRETTASTGHDCPCALPVQSRGYNKRRRSHSHDAKGFVEHKEPIDKIHKKVLWRMCRDKDAYSAILFRSVGWDCVRAKNVDGEEPH